MVRKTLQELTIMDNFMFGAVMLDEENCRLLLERILETEIERVEVSTEKSMVYHPEFHGVRLDVYAKDEKNSHYNVEMQVSKKPVLRRSRYYHSQIDMDILRTGVDYEMLPDTYVIFICNYDPFGLEKYRYTFTKVLKEDKEYTIEDGVHTIILSNRGKNSKEVSPELVSFLEYTKDKTAKESEDAFVKKIQESIDKIKADREMEAKYMSFEMYIYDQRKEARAEGRAEGRIEGLSDAAKRLLKIKGFANLSVEEKLSQIVNETNLDQIMAKITEAQSVEEIEEYVYRL